ncbi:MAG: DUF3562 domain-containing protein [Parcubacteria group bacterium]|nr:DUF3562 domain-containing protein [Parcubacteria group bacterium]
MEINESGVHEAEIKELIRRYRNVEPNRVKELYEKFYSDLREEAKVKKFLPLIVRRKVIETLSQ